MNDCAEVSDKDYPIVEQLAGQLFKLFVSRTDCYCSQQKNGSYTKVDMPLTMDVVLNHLNGELTVGSYQLGADNSTKYLCFDFDPEHLQDPKLAVQKLLDVLFMKKEEADSVKRPRIWPDTVLLEASRFPDPSWKSVV